MQEIAKPALLPLLLGQPCTLYRKQQTLIASWVAMSIITAEWRSAPYVAVTQAERDKFRESKRVPKGWRIWMGQIPPKAWQGKLVHHAIPIRSEKHIVEVMDGNITRPNTQASTFVVGGLFFTAISSPITSMVRDWHFGQRGRELLAQIWPIKRSAVVWPLPLMTATDAEVFAEAFFLSGTKLPTGPIKD